MAKRKRKNRKRTNSNVPAKGTLRDMADRLWSLAVRNDWNWKCAVCGCGGSGKLEAHHLLPRQHENYRYDLRNGICLCSRHHQFHPDTSPHQNAAGWVQWLAEYQPNIHRWYIETNSGVRFRQFKGIKNAAYYCDVIRSLRQYVDDEDYVRIVGVKFSRWLEENE